MRVYKQSNFEFRLYINMGNFGIGHFLPDPVSDFLDVPGSAVNAMIFSSEI